ncbi:MAG: ribosome biogenesis GTPase Der, partial [Chloroflexi bacterium]|nr:ribosome biogenesis GTPase Der [Chloroflexota bacterium]
MSKPLVAIVGRQNVGKSTLLNRLAGEQISIVADLPGTTRDRIMANVSWREKEFTVIDTAGLELRPETDIGQKVKAQVETAIAEADAIIFVTDVQQGIAPLDQEIASMLRRANKPVLLVANKADNANLEISAVEFYQLGLGEPLAISAYHRRGIDELLDRIIALIPSSLPAIIEPEAIKVAIAGRPNVGKSALLNALLGEERAIVNEVPGTTRDAIDTLLDFRVQCMVIIDTAGLRRRGRVGTGIERYSVLRTLRAIDRADITILVLIAEEQVTDQDLN